MAPPPLPDAISRACVIALPRAGGAALLLAGAGHDALERVLRKVGIDPAACVLGRAVIDAVLPEFLPRPEPLAEDSELLDRITPACLLARPYDGTPPVLLSGGTAAELERVLRALGYPPHTYAIAGARLSQCVLVDAWDTVHERRYAHG